MTGFKSTFGQLLYQWLPAVYRERDYPSADESSKLGHLARYLDAHGLLLDRIRATLDQRLADAFPDNPDNGLACQEWLIPYFARLLDVSLVSPDLIGQRDEVANAIRWRQGKGTLVTAEEIAEAITRSEVELQEGWRRVAVTPRIGMPLPPASVYGVMTELNPRWTSQITRHPGLPAATIGLRCISRAVQTEVISPAVKTSRLGSTSVQWMQANPHGVPFAPDSFDDVSRRTVDFRTPTLDQGHAHPKRLLVYAAMPTGLFPFPTISVKAEELEKSPLISWIKNNETLNISSVSGQALIVEDDFIFQSEASSSAAPFTVSGVQTVTIEGLCFKGKINANLDGVLTLRKVAINELTIESHIRRDVLNKPLPVLEATSCLFNKLTVTSGLARLEYCTVLGSVRLATTQASECIFPDDTRIDLTGATCLRYSRLPPTLKTDKHLPFCTTETPVYFENSFVKAAAGASGCGVLHPATSEAVRFGAEDGGELGVYHHLRYSLVREALLEKLGEHLPIGVEPVLIPDRRILQQPVRQKTTLPANRINP